VIRTWDKRRLIVPITYFMDHPFQNWSRSSQQIIKPVVIHADYRIDVDAVRAELQSILEGSDLWDREVPPILQVIDCTEETIALRALCSARDAATSWDLHCLVRERLINFIRDLEGGRYLPRRRVLLVEGAQTEGQAKETDSDGRAQDRSAQRNGAATSFRKPEDDGPEEGTDREASRT
jgi:hypothetical protein